MWCGKCRLLFAFLRTLAHFSAIFLSSFLNSPGKGIYQPSSMGIANPESKALYFLPYYPACLVSSPFCSDLWMFSGLSLENLLTNPPGFPLLPDLNQRLFCTDQLCSPSVPICFMSSRNSSKFWLIEDTLSYVLLLLRFFLLIFINFFWENDKKVC